MSNTQPHVAHALIWRACVLFRCQRAFDVLLNWSSYVWFIWLQKWIGNERAKRRLENPESQQAQKRLKVPPLVKGPNAYNVFCAEFFQTGKYSVFNLFIYLVENILSKGSIIQIEWPVIHQFKYVPASTLGTIYNSLVIMSNVLQHISRKHFIVSFLWSADTFQKGSNNTSAFLRSKQFF